MKSSKKKTPKSDSKTKEVFCRYITRNGKRIYPKKAKCFHFYVQ